MTAASAYPPPPEQGQTEGRVSEPSMEDILASIRRIIADDQIHGSRPGPGRKAQAEVRTPDIDHRNPLAADAAQAHREGALDLAHFVPSAGDPDSPGNGTAASIDAGEAPHDLGAEAADAEQAYLHTASEHTDRHLEPATPAMDAEDHHMHDDFAPTDDDHEGGTLLSVPMGETVMSAFEALAATVVLENRPMLEQILRDLLRPMLKTWLDDHLPGLVERLVRSEIERVARGGRP